MSAKYPTANADRDRFILEGRGARKRHDPWRYQDLVVEDELTSSRGLAPTATVFLTGKECAWRCVMCDLWQYTTAENTVRGAIPAQIVEARRVLDMQGQAVSQLKLYNASNFFDPHAVPLEDYAAIAAALPDLDLLVVESHPALIGHHVDRFLEALSSSKGRHASMLEVAMGLETANRDALERLNKGLTIERFSTAAEALRDRGVALRVFVLISPPFIAAPDQDRWLLESIDCARSCGAAVISLIPTRAGNGAMETLAAVGLYDPPTLTVIEQSFDLALAHGRRTRVFVDVWDLERFSRCGQCFAPRKKRLQTMNLTQQVTTRIACVRCGDGLSA
jgi:radical SAM enzyme (TIGR01210 family)